MLNNWKAFLQTTVGRFTGDTDVLEAVIATGIAVAMADGTVNRQEIDATLTAAKGNALIKRLFTDDVIDRTKDKFLAKLRAAPNMNTAFKELQDVGGREEDVRHAVYLCGCQVAAAQDGVSAEEQKILDQCANYLNILPEDKKQIEQNAVGKAIVLDF